MKNSIKKFMAAIGAASVCAVSMGSTLSAGAAEIDYASVLKTILSDTKIVESFSAENTGYVLTDKTAVRRASGWCGNEPRPLPHFPVDPRPDDPDWCGTPHKIPVSAIRDTLRKH